MTTNRKLNIGLIGCGWITENVHIPGLLLSGGAALRFACDANLEAAQHLAAVHDIPYVTQDYEDVLADKEVDAVIIATPNNLHKPITLAAIEAKKHVLCEKPIGLNLGECREMATAIEGTGLTNVVSFLYRFVPAMRYIRHLIDEGAFGEIRHFRANYLQLVPEFYLGWRSNPELNGPTGALGDVGVHLIDFARYLVGDFRAVSGYTKTFLHERVLPATGEMIPCELDDAAGYLAEFENGATGVFEVSRLVPGRGCGLEDHQYVEVNGTKGTAVYSLQSPFSLEICPGQPYDATRLIKVKVPESFLRSAHSQREVLATAPNLGFRYDQGIEFVRAIQTGDQNTLPDIVDGLKAQAVVDAVLQSSQSRNWVSVQAK